MGLPGADHEISSSASHAVDACCSAIVRVLSIFQLYARRRSRLLGNSPPVMGKVIQAMPALRAGEVTVGRVRCGRHRAPCARACLVADLPLGHTADMGPYDAHI